MKRLTLVNPSKKFNTGIIPLGLASISAYLKTYAKDIEIIFLDANCQDIYMDFVPTDIVAVTSVTQTIGDAIEFAKYVKTFGNIPLILGGVHISTYRILPEPFDIGVIGEGEQTMLELIQARSLSKDCTGEIKGICCNVHGKTVFTGSRPLIEDLDTIPIPDREMANMKHYLRRIRSQHP